VEKYAHLASYEEIKENDFNLNIPRYVDTFEEEEPVDMAAVSAEIKEIRKEKAKLESSLYDMISSLQFEEKNAEWIKGALEVFRRGE
jgi:type I restriction enzyme M protein